MAAAEITREETRERARLLRIDSYDVALDLTRGGEVFGSTTVIRFDCSEPGAQTYADLVAEQVHEITLNGVQLDPATVWAGDRVVLAGLAARNELRVVADARFASDGTAMHRSVDSADGRVYLYTKFEPAAARRVFTTFEQPDLKATFTFHVTAPAHWTVLSCQPAPEPESAGDGTAVWDFPPTPRISTYLTEIIAGDFHVVRDAHTTPSGQVIPLAVACRRSLAVYLDADVIFETTRQGLDFYTTLFQRDYPFTKYDQVFVPEFAGAMENVGCITITERLLFRSRTTEATYERRAEIVLHEMAHMWFGDLVTMRWFDDLWLNESFADYCAALSAAEAARIEDAWPTFAGTRKFWGYTQDQLPTTHPIAAYVPTVSAAMANFDGISYAKGAAVLKQLVTQLGREEFFTGVRAYLAANAWGNATLTDLLHALEASAGQDLAQWSEAWLETAGPNTLRPQIEVDGDGVITEFAIIQDAPAEHPVLRPHHIAVGLYGRGGGDTGSSHGTGQQDGGAADRNGALVRQFRTETDVAGRRTVVPALAGQPQPDLILLNDDDLGYALIRFDDRSMRTLAESIGDVADPLARTICWTAVLDMVAQAEMPVPEFMTILISGIRQEQSIPLLQLILTQVQDLILGIFAEPSDVRAGKERAAQEFMRLMLSAEWGSDLQLAAAQALSWSAVNDEQLHLLESMLDGSVDIAGLDVDTDLRWATLARLAATGRAADSDIDAELELDSTDDGRRQALACRAAIPDPEHKAAAWELLAGDAEIGHETAILVGRAFRQPEHAELLEPYTEAYFEVLPKLWETRSHQSRIALGRMLFPYPAASAGLVARVDAFLAEPDRDSGLVRLLVEQRDVVERALRSRTISSGRP